MIIDEYQHRQLQHKKLPPDIQFFDKQGQHITYKINYEDTAADRCNYFYPIHCQQGNDQKILQLHNDGENFSLNSNNTALATSSVQLAADCFRMGKAINQFRRLCRPQPPVSLSSSESSNGTYNTISVTETAGTEEPGLSLRAQLIVHKDCDDHEVEYTYICEINANDHYRLCKGRAAHDSVLSESNAFLSKKTLSTTAAAHLRTQDFITKLNDVAMVVDLDVPTLLQLHFKDQVLSIVRTWMDGKIFSDLKVPEIRQSKSQLRYCQELDRLLIQEHGQLLCYNEPSDTLDKKT